MLKMVPANPAHKTLKLTALTILTIQAVAHCLSIRYARKRPGPMFFYSTAVLNTEILKLGICLVKVYIDVGDLKSFINLLRSLALDNFRETIKICIPGFLYVLQNNLLYVAASNLNSVTYQITLQLKIFTTAIFSILILQKKLAFVQWCSLVVLVTGIIVVKLSQGPERDDEAVFTATDLQDTPIGFLAISIATSLSGFAGVFLEKILQGSDVSLWIRNVQLSFCSIPFALLTCVHNDAYNLRTEGYFHGYDVFVWYFVALQAGGGLLIAIVIKYAGNILKNFSTSLAIIISCILSSVIFGVGFNLELCSGIILVIISIPLYSYTSGST